MGRLPHFSPPNRFLNGVGTRNIKDNSIEQGKDDMHDADKRISRDTYQEGEDEAGWRPHGPKPHLEEKSIDLSSTSMTVPPTTTGGCPASTPELKSLFERSGVSRILSTWAWVDLLRARWLCSHWGAGQAPARNPTGTNSSTWCNQPRLDHRSSLSGVLACDRLILWKIVGSFRNK